MVKVKDVLAFIDKIAPFRYAMKHDSCGLLIGDSEKRVEKILISLDITEPVIMEAVEKGVDLIVSHHPFFFEPFTIINDSTYHGKMALKLIENGIGIICAHTNLDSAKGGINDVLCEKIKLSDVQLLKHEEYDFEDAGIMRIGTYENEITMENFLRQIKSNLHCEHIVYTGNLSDKVQKVAVCSGSGASFTDIAIQSGADTYFMGEAKYGNVQYALQSNLNIVMAGHFETENIICEVLLDKFKDKFEGIWIEIAKSNTNMISYY